MSPSLQRQQAPSGYSPGLGPLALSPASARPGRWQQETPAPSALFRACSLREPTASGTLKLSFVYYINPYKKISFNEE